MSSHQNANTTTSERWNSVEYALKSSAESKIGRTTSMAKRDVPQCADIAAMCAKEHRKLSLAVVNRNASVTWFCTLYADKAEAIIDNLASEVERLHDASLATQP